MKTITAQALLDIKIKVLDSSEDAERLIAAPATICIRGQPVIRIKHCCDCLDAFDIDIW